MGESKRVMFCCEECADNYPEGCGYFDRSDLRVMPNDKWLCGSCFDECDAYDYGFRGRDEDGELVKPDWADLPAPPALVRSDLAEQMAAALRELTEAKALSGVRQQVAGWNGEGRDEPYKERHPSRLGATLPKTNCGAVYELDEAMQRANAILQAYEAAQPANQTEAR